MVHNVERSVLLSSGMVDAELCRLALSHVAGRRLAVTPASGRVAGVFALASLRETEYAALASCATGMHAVCLRTRGLRGVMRPRDVQAVVYPAAVRQHDAQGGPHHQVQAGERSRYIREGLGLCAHSARRTVTLPGSGMSSMLLTWCSAAWPAMWPCCSAAAQADLRAARGHRRLRDRGQRGEGRAQRQQARAEAGLPALRLPGRPSARSRTPP